MDNLIFPCTCRLSGQEDLSGPGMALGSLLGPEGRPMSLESGFRTGQRGVGTTSRWAEAKKSFRELPCFWESGTVGASGLTGRPLPPCLPWRESTLREFPGLAQLAVSFPAETLPRSPGGVHAPPPSQQALAREPTSQPEPYPDLVLRRPTGCTA